jgi:epoxyqueuosine reductase
MARPSTDAVVRKALGLGFAAAGVATAGPAETMDRFRSWLASGSAAGMSYLSRHDALRSDPRNLTPGVRSIIAVAAGYPVNPDPASGGFSSLSWGADYHDVVRKRLRELAEWLGRAEPLRTARVCVDSAPLLDREWALRAGMARPPGAGSLPRGRMLRGAGIHPRGRRDGANAFRAGPVRRLPPVR